MRRKKPVPSLTYLKELFDIDLNGKRHHLGTFHTLSAATEVRQAAVKEHRPNFAAELHNA